VIKIDFKVEEHGTELDAGLSSDGIQFLVSWPSGENIVKILYGELERDAKRKLKVARINWV